MIQDSFSSSDKIRFIRPPAPTLDQLLPKWLKDDVDAIAFIHEIHKIAECWDDIIDEETVTDLAVNKAFYGALVTLPRNQFYRQHFGRLNPLVESAIFDWWAANDLEMRGGDSLRSSYILRCAGLSLTVMCACIIGGVEWATFVSKELRSMGDTWDEYAAKHGVT